MNKQFIVAQLKEIASDVSKLDKTASLPEGKKVRDLLEKVENSARESVSQIEKCSKMFDKIAQDEDALKYSEDFEYVLFGAMYQAEKLARRIHDLREKTKKMG